MMTKAQIIGSAPIIPVPDVQQTVASVSYTHLTLPTKA